eukprot:8717425-Pyramimonas_sp.AAC.1
MSFASAPRTLVFNVCSSFNDGGRVVFEMRLSLLASRTFVSKFAAVSGLKGVLFKMWLSP